MSRNTIFNFCCYALLMAAGIWAATRGEFGIAALVFYGSSMLLISRLLHGVGSVDPDAKDNMPDPEVIKRYREQNPGSSITEAINDIVTQRNKR